MYQDGKIDSGTRFLQKQEQYDKRGNLIASASYSREPGFKDAIDSLVFEYDHDNRMIKFTVYNGNKMQSIWKSKYDSKGRQREMNCYSGDNRLLFIQKTIYNGDIQTGQETYDQDGRLKDSSKLIRRDKLTREWIKYNNRGVIETRIVNKQNNKGLPVEEQYYMADAKSSSIYKHTYTSQDIPLLFQNIVLVWSL